MDTPPAPPQAVPQTPPPTPGADPVRPRRVFLSYRRRDAKDIAGRIRDYLSDSYGEENVFIDLTSIAAGAKFKDVVHEAIGSCDVFILLLSPQWAAIEEDGRRRIDDPQDLYRQEIEAALAREVPLFPVLVGGAVMPEKEELPPSLHRLLELQAVPVRPDPDFRGDMASLLEPVHVVAPPNEPLEAAGVEPAAAATTDVALSVPLARRTLLLYAALFSWAAFFAIHFLSLPRLVQGILVVLAPVVTLLAALASYLPTEGLKKFSVERVRSALERSEAMPVLLVALFLSVLAHLSLSTLVLRYDPKQTEVPQLAVRVSRGGREMDGSPFRLSAIHPSRMIHAWFPFFRRSLQVEIANAAGYGRLDRNIPLFFRLDLDIPAVLHCSDCLILRVLPSGELFQRLSVEKGDAWTCCRLTLRTDGREPLELDLMQAALYLGADEKEVEARLDREEASRPGLYDTFLDAGDVDDPDVRAIWKESWSRSRIEPRWKLEENQEIEMIVNKVDGCEVYRQTVKVQSAELFQTVALGQGQRLHRCD